MHNIPQDYLDLIRKIYEERYKRKLTEEEVSRMAENLMNFARVVRDFYKKRPNILAEMKKKVKKAN